MKPHKISIKRKKSFNLYHQKNKFVLFIGEDGLLDNNLPFDSHIEEFLKKSKHNLYIGSNSMKNRILDGLKRVGLEKYFNPNHIYSFDLVDNPKPHPDIYLKAVNDNDLIIDETIIIEDSVVGVNAGKNAKIKVIGLTAGGHWHTDRDEKELINAGAIATANNYNKIEEIIESL